MKPTSTFYYYYYYYLRSILVRLISNPNFYNSIKACLTGFEKRRGWRYSSVTVLLRLRLQTVFKSSSGYQNDASWSRIWKWIDFRDFLAICFTWCSAQLICSMNFNASRSTFLHQALMPRPVRFSLCWRYNDLVLCSTDLTISFKINMGSHEAVVIG